MARLRIDVDDLAIAMSDHDNEWVLDMETGKVLMADWVRDADMHEDMGLVLDEAAGDDDDLGEFEPLESDRFRLIESIHSHQGFRWMERFAASQDDIRVRDHLLDALDRPKPFRRFKDALMDFPEARDAWFRYEEARLREEAEAWLQSEDIDAELVDVHGAAKAPTQAEE
jgi:hypothetical protein